MIHCFALYQHTHTRCLR